VGGGVGGARLERGRTGWDRDRLERLILETLRDGLLETGAGFDRSSDLIEAGVDSLAVTQLLLAIEEHTGLWVDESLLTPEHLQSVRTLATLIHAELEAR
jgi:acyl carrier protein